MAKYIDMGSFSYCNLPHLAGDKITFFDPAEHHIDYVLHTDGVWYTADSSLEDWDAEPPVELWDHNVLGAWPFGDPYPTAKVEIVNPSEWDSTQSDMSISGSETSYSGSSSSWVLDPTSSESEEEEPLEDLLTPPTSDSSMEVPVDGALAFAQGLMEHLDDPDGASFWDAYDNNYSF